MTKTDVELPRDRRGHPRFDLGLTMAGAISAGAYSAGVVDFMIEALDTWDHGKATNDPHAPQHSVGLNVISGASAGAITSAALAACLAHEFPHPRTRPPGKTSGNPLYDCWVQQIAFEKLLAIDDLSRQGNPASLLDSSCLDPIARDAMNFGIGMPRFERSYLGNPLRLIFTLTNLRGVPFEGPEDRGTYHPDYMMHGDWQRFALQGVGGVESRPLQADEYPLAYPENLATEKWASWKEFAQTALASGAFPGALAPRRLKRRRTDYNGLPVVGMADDGTKPELLRINPRWPACMGSSETDFEFLSADGGTIDNEPLELARIELAGGDPLARNPRGGMEARRAVILVDPFVGPEGNYCAAALGAEFPGSLLATFNAIKNQARFRPHDIALATRKDIYSRFLIAPKRKGRESNYSGSSLVGGCLGGFGGFLDENFRAHDYFLGRYNCQKFLRDHLALPANHVLFNQWTADQRTRYLIKAGESNSVDELPIIPLLPSVRSDTNPLQVPDWPAGAFDPESLAAPIDRRLDGLFKAYSHEQRWDQKLLGAVLWLGWKLYGRGKLREYALRAIRNGLKTHGL